MGQTEGDLEANDIDYTADYRAGFHDFYVLMKFRVSKILLVSSLYDAFTLEEDGLIFEQISQQYKELALPFPPQVLRVSSGSDGLEELKVNRYDMVITMARISDMTPEEFGNMAKEIQKGIPVVLLLNDAGDLQLHKWDRGDPGYDYIFFWNGDSSLLMAMTKFIEDSKNIDQDIRTGRVRAILVVENNPRFYSVFLPLIYTEIMNQTLSLLTEGLNEHEKMLRKRARPKILLARDYEEASDILRKYSRYIIGVISDISYPKGGMDEEEAGFHLAHEFGEQFPILLQSTRSEHREKAEAMGLPFIFKNSETILKELKEFFNKHLGFGAFEFTMPDGTVVGRAFDINELTDLLPKVPAVFIRIAGRGNRFSKWLIARQELGLAMKLRSKKVTDFGDDEEIRDYLLREIRESRRVKQLGVITDFDKQRFEFEGSFTRLGGGSLGGKGRGIAFLSSLLHQSGIKNTIEGCRILIPETLVIATDVFDRFLKEHGIAEKLTEDLDDDDISRLFLSFELPKDILDKLGTYLENVNVPIAVRSSSLLEDSQNQPFAGIYTTYILPNTCGDAGARLDQLSSAIRLVYASTYYRRARAYLQSTIHMPEEEKMAVVLQKLVGSTHGDRFYPVISGVAQSHNFYPIGPLKREEGIVSVALGLGRIVVEGGNVLNFSPEHPNVIPGFSTPEDALKNSQSYFFSLNMSPRECYDLRQGEDVTLLTLPISEAEKDGTLDLIASTFDVNDNRIRDGLGFQGPRVIDFAGILKYGKLPLVNIIRTILAMGRNGMGRAVEIEFAVKMQEKETPEFHIVQIRPLVTLKERRNVMITDQDRKNAILYTDRALGNCIIERIQDLVFVETEGFDKTRTVEIAELIGEANRLMKERPYILLGPGRWGTQDRFLGIPVEWDQISGARCMVEVSIPDFQIDPSLGTHFFHNITSLGIPYFTVLHNRKDHVFDEKWMKQNVTTDLKGLVKMIRLEEPLCIKVDGRTGQGIILPFQGES